METKIKKQDNCVNDKKVIERIEKYRTLTGKALVKIKIKNGLTSEMKEHALDFLEMARAYYNDSIYLQEKKLLLESLCALSYAHGWLDSGVRLGLFEAFGDNKLFVLPKKEK